MANPKSNLLMKIIVNLKVIIHDQKKVDIEERRLRLELEIEEQKMSLKERDIALRKAVAEVEAIEIANEKAKLALKNN
ncbi:unnamed protein product [Rhizophagus irregularis]|nr:unnamed protein product [Rhizophagus irregularis]